MKDTSSVSLIVFFLRLLCKKVRKLPIIMAEVNTYTASVRLKYLYFIPLPRSIYLSIKPRISGSVAKDSDHWTTDEVLCVCVCVCVCVCKFQSLIVPKYNILKFSVKQCNVRSNFPLIFICE
jgi:hypothetical protein